MKDKPKDLKKLMQIDFYYELLRLFGSWACSDEMPNYRWHHAAIDSAAIRTELKILKDNQ